MKSGSDFHCSQVVIEGTKGPFCSPSEFIVIVITLQGVGVEARPIPFPKMIISHPKCPFVMNL